MTVEEFVDMRERKWRLRSELALTTENEILRFVRDVGAASIAVEKKCLFPSLAQAIDGSPHRRHARWQRNRPYAELIERFCNRYFESRRVFAVSLPSNTQGVVSREWMVALLALCGKKNSGHRRQRYSVKPQFSRFELAVHDMVRKKGPISKKHLVLALNLWSKTSRRKLEKGLLKLWKALRILRVGCTRQEGTIWDVPIRWDPSLQEEADGISRERAAAELIKKYVEMAVATNRKRMSKAFRGILTSSEISDTLHYLLLKKSIVVDTQLVLDGKKALTAGPKGFGAGLRR
jgi:hypothetical protein